MLQTISVQQLMILGLLADGRSRLLIHSDGHVSFTFFSEMLEQV